VPAGMTRDEYRALILRSEGLNQKYAVGNSVAPQGMTADEYRALILRSEGLNQKYGGSLDSLTLERGANQRFAADNNARGDLVDSTPSDTSPAFQWGDAGIGAGVLLGVVALIGAGLFEVRHHARLGTS
jgi:hypothetical protein